MTLGDKIKFCRKQANLSQETIAEMVGVSRQAVTKAAPSTENLFRLAEIFGTTVDSLIKLDKQSSAGTEVEKGITPEKGTPGISDFHPDNRSTAEHIYHLCKADHEQESANRRSRCEKNVRMVLLIIAGYLAIYVIGRLICGDRSESSFMGWLFGADSKYYLFGWLLSSRMYWFAVTVSVISAFFGTYRFSITTFLAFICGIFLGEFLGAKGMLGFGNYGWVIWGAVFFLSMSIGIALERFAKQGISVKSKRGLMWIGTTLVILLVIICAIACHTPTMNDVIQSAPSFRGTVMEVTDTAVLVKVAEDEEESQTSDTIWVSLDVELEDGRITCYVGEGICVYYDGTILETYPAQVNNVYGMTLVRPSDLRNLKDTYSTENCK